MTNLDSILKNRNITLPVEVHIVKAMVFPLVLYGYENWTVKKAKIMSSGPITSWQIDGATVEIFLGAPKSLQMVIAAMQLRHLVLRRKAMTNLDSILKSRDITLPTKVHLV